MNLMIEPNIEHADDFYEALIDMHRDLDDAQSQSANAQLILLLANHIGDHATLLEAMQHARDGVIDVSARDTQAHSLAA